jgi:Mg/Co/Ni transporter MgtE
VIVTRRRRKKTKWGWLLAVCAILAVCVALAVSPTWRRQIAAAFVASATHRALAQRVRTIADLRAQVAAQQKPLEQLGTASRADVGSATSEAAPSALPSLAPPTAAPAPGDMTAGATPDMRRTAQLWAAMDPDDAAKIVRRMRPEYAARIFALMPADAAGQILDALPAAYGASVTQEEPQLRT